MLDKVDLSLKLDKQEYKKNKSLMEENLGELQRKAKELGIPVMIVFEGWGAAGKGTFINDLILPLDPRGFSIYTTNVLNEDERMRPFLWRYWTRTPARGRIAIFDRSWYRKASVDRVDNHIEGEELKNVFHDINSFEKQLTQDGYVIIKFFLHISQKEQRNRFKKLERNSSTAWRVTEADWKHNEQYEKYLTVTEEMIEETNKDYAPWTIVEAEDKYYSEIKIFSKVIDILEKSISDELRKKEERKDSRTLTSDDDRVVHISQFKTVSMLNKVDLTLKLSKDAYKEKLKKYQETMRELEHEIYRKRIPVVILYEGWDAAGKGGNIKRITENMDPRGYEVIPIGAPTELEKAHHYLWRFWKDIPKAGHMAIFDRSWYGRVLVERIEGFCTVEEWQRAYEEITDMEKQLANFGFAIIKFWLQIDKDEQLARFKERQEDPKKQWKITEEDWRNRDKWDQYEVAVNDMLAKTSTSYAPWTIIESNDKLYARIKALETVIHTLKSKL